MAALAEFFKGSETTLGTFYPNHCLLAVFPNGETAQRAVSKLNFAGFTLDEAIAAPQVRQTLPCVLPFFGCDKK